MMDGRADPDTIVKPEPSRAYRWAVLLAMSLAVYGSYYAFDCIGPLAPLLSRQLHFADSDIGLLQAIYSFPNIFMMLVSGVIIDRIGAKKSVFLFGFTTFVGLIVTALTPRLGVMAAGRLIVGVGAESLAIATIAGNARWFRGKELSLSYGVKATIERFGSLSAQVSPAWMAAAYAYWQWPLLVAVGFGTCCVIGAALYWILESRGERRYNLGDEEQMEKVPFRAAFKFNRSYWLIVLMCVTWYSGIFPFLTFAQKFLIQARQVTPQSASLFVGMLPFFSMIGTPLFGHLVDRVARRSLFMMFGALLLLPVYLLLAYANIPLAIPMAMMGIAFALVPAVMWPCIAYVVQPSRLGFAYGLMDAVQQFGLTGFNLLIGWSNDHYAASVANPAGYRPGMWMFSCVGVVAMLFAIGLRRVETGPHKHGLETIRS
ncbi:MAG: MFS transporter [Acidobacteriota bacterium]|jgi:MFS family permease